MVTDAATARIVALYQLYQPYAKRQLDQDKVAATLSDSYEVDHGESTRDCHSRLAISYGGAAVATEIDYQVIQTDDGKIIARWARVEQLPPTLFMQLMLQVGLAEEQAKTSNSR